MPSISFVAPTRPVSAVLAPAIRRPAPDVEAQILSAASPEPAGEPLPDYAEALRSEPPHYNPFSSAKQAFWHLSGVPRAAGAVAGLVPLAAGAGGAAIFHHSSVQQAVKTCMQTVSLDPYLCQWAFGLYYLSAKQCQDLCLTQADNVIAQSTAPSSAFADPVVRGFGTAGIVLGAAAAALAAASVGARVAQRVLYERRPDVAAARQRSAQSDIALETFSAV